MDADRLDCMSKKNMRMNYNTIGSLAIIQNMKQTHVILKSLAPEYLFCLDFLVTYKLFYPYFYTRFMHFVLLEVCFLVTCKGIRKQLCTIRQLFLAFYHIFWSFALVQYPINNQANCLKFSQQHNFQKAVAILLFCAVWHKSHTAAYIVQLFC